MNRIGAAILAGALAAAAGPLHAEEANDEPPAEAASPAAPADAAQQGEGGRAPAPGEAAPVFTLPTVEIVGTTPVHGVGIEKDKVPANVQTVAPQALTEPATANLGDVLNTRIGSVTVNHTTVSPMQPDINFRGFTASPLLGVPQGIAIYQNGIRVNEPFGDTVQWDIVPEFAIDNVQVIPGSNPVFGLNALGGAMTLQMKNGFNFEGARADAYGGSFVRKHGTGEYGVNFGNWGFYAGATGFDEDGFRRLDQAASTVKQAFADARYRGEEAELGLSLGFADTNMAGVQPAPKELLDIDRSDFFTGPDFTANKLLAISGDGNWFATDTLSVQGNAYYRHLMNHGLASNNTEFEDCTGVGGPPGTLCEDAGLPTEAQILDVFGNPIPTAAGGDMVDVLPTIDSEAFGGSLQGTLTEEIFGLPNQFIAGGSIDMGQVRFHSATEIGTLDDDRLVVPAGIFAGGEEFNVDLKTRNDYFGLYFSDTLSLTDTLALTAAGRYNYAHVVVTDLFGTDLSGDHKFIRFNPAVGATYRFADDLTGYASYSEANRAPTAVELSCADPDEPCRLPNAFLADPPLRQVVSRSVEAGLRGRVRALEGEPPVNWSVAAFGARNFDDIIFVSVGTGQGTGFFQNAGITQRVGVELGLNGRAGDFSWYANYSYVRATFESHLLIASEANPQAVDGEIQVVPGDRIPGIPEHSAKLGVAYDVTERLSVALESIVSGSQYFRGDEANNVEPVPAYAILNLSGAYRVTDHLEAFVKVENLFDTEYETFGVLGDPSEAIPGMTDPRFLSPGPPIGAWAGLRITL